jgi:alkylation response protein AidB-like acyl-CoA dehydrogenase
MSYADLDIELNDEQKATRDMARRFGREVMRPAGIDLDELADPAMVIADGSVLWDVFRQYRELGLHRRAFPKAVGGLLEEMDRISGTLVSEEFGYWDAGLAISLGVAGHTFRYASMSSDPELQGWSWVPRLATTIRAPDPRCGRCSRGTSTSSPGRRPPG